jgi:hypothetical protein
MFHFLRMFLAALAPGRSGDNAFVSNARLPAGVAGLRENSRGSNTLAFEKIIGKRLGMPHYYPMPPFRLRYGGLCG